MVLFPHDMSGGWILFSGCGGTPVRRPAVATRYDRLVSRFLGMVLATARYRLKFVNAAHKKES